MTAFTERQAAAWPKVIAEIESYDVSVDSDLFRWSVQWSDETRPGRGHYFSAMWADGEHFVQVLMDVYGYPTVSIASLDLIHNSSDDECPCDPCRAYADEDGAA